MKKFTEKGLEINSIFDPAKTTLAFAGKTIGLIQKARLSLNADDFNTLPMVSLDVFPGKINIIGKAKINHLKYDKDNDYWVVDKVSNANVKVYSENDVGTIITSSDIKIKDMDKGEFISFVSKFEWSVDAKDSTTNIILYIKDPGGIIDDSNKDFDIEGYIENTGSEPTKY